MESNAIEIEPHWMRKFIPIWIAQIFSLLGSGLVAFALVWWITQKTGSAALLATATFVAILPEVLLAPFAGALVDRLSEKEEGLPQWLRAAQQHGRLRAGVDPQYAAHQLHGLVKYFAFWPQLAMGRAPLTAAEQQQVLGDAVDMFLGFYAVRPAMETTRTAAAPAKRPARTTRPR